MFKHLKNESGIALIMVIILLVLVGGLTAALLTAGIFNIGFGSDEVDRAQAFYAADAGVQYAKNALSNFDFENMDSDNPFSEIETDNWENLSADNTRFKVEMKQNDNEDDNDRIATFISTGKVNSGLNNRTITQKIEFSFDIDLFFDLAMLIDGEEENKEDSIQWDGPDDDSGADYDYTMDKIRAIDLPDWWDFLHPEGADEDNRYIKVHESDESGTKGIESFEDFEDGKIDEEKLTGGAGQRKLEEIYDEFGENNTSKIFFTPQEVTVEGVKDYEAGSYNEGEVVYYEVNDEVNYYVANQDIKEDDLPPDESDYWDLIDYDEIGNYDLGGNIEIRNSIVIVDGNFSAGGNVAFKDSLILVKNEAAIAGGATFDNSLVMAFNQSNEDVFVRISGPPSFDLKLRSDIDEEWHGVDELDLGDLILDHEFLSWRHVK